MKGENLPVIFGLKLRNIRDAMGLGLKELSERVGMSASYLNEIEKGKKYPKADKILQIAQALNIPYDEMVSLKLGKELGPLETFLESPLIQALPLQMFGLVPRDILDLISRAPKEVSALIRALLDITERYDMQVEHFFHAMLRSYQETHNNYFEDIEQSVAAFAAAHGMKPPVGEEALRTVLEDEYQVIVDEERLQTEPALSGFRSVWINAPPERLLLNPRLTGRQKAFQIGREIGYRQLRLKARGATSSRAEVESFEQVLNDFKASYYSGALLIDQAILVEDIQAFFKLPAWDGQALVSIMNRFQVTPEMFLYRLTQLLPTHFGLEGLQFFRVHHNPEKNSFHINKQLNLGTQDRAPGMGSGEHHCRRWMAIDLLKTLAAQPHLEATAPPLVAAQRIRFVEDGSEFFLITLARSLALTPGSNTSVTLAMALNDAFRGGVAFHADERVPVAEVSDSCERCPLSPAQCGQRVAPPRIYEARLALDERRKALEKVFTGGHGE